MNYIHKTLTIVCEKSEIFFLTSSRMNCITYKNCSITFKLALAIGKSNAVNL